MVLSAGSRCRRVAMMGQGNVSRPGSASSRGSSSGEPTPVPRHAGTGVGRDCFRVLPSGQADRSGQKSEIVQHATCELCGPQHERVYRAVRGHYSSDQFVIRTCRSCGLVFVSPRLSSAFRSFCYEYEEHLVEHFLRSSEEARRGADRQLDVLETLGCHAGKLLDVGCGIGTFLDVASGRGFDTWGIELNRGCAAYASKRHRVLRVDFLVADVPTAEYDVIVMNQTLEHLGEPLRALTVAAQALRPGGLLFVGVPRCDWVSLTVGSVLRSRSSIAGRFSPAWSPEDHLYYFTPKCMRRYLEAVLMTVEQMRSRRHGGRIAKVLGLSDGEFLARKPA